MSSLKRQSRSGMTLVEILFAFAIMTSVITLAYAAGLRAWRTAQAGNQRTQAQYIAQDALERVKAYRDTPDFIWSGAASLAGRPGSGGFLQDIEAASGAGVGNPNSFYVDLCTPAEGCTYKVSRLTGTNLSGGPAITKPEADQRITDNTDFFVSVTVTNHYTLAGLNDEQPGFPVPDADVQAITLEARVEWTSATGVPSNTTASTILTRDGAGS